MNYNMRLVLGGVLNVTQLVGVSTSLYTMDAYGRRPLLLIGSVCMTIAHVIIAVLVGLYYDDWTNHKAQGWVAVGFLFFYMLAFGCTYGPGKSMYTRTQTIGPSIPHSTIAKFRRQMTNFSFSAMGYAIRDFPQLVTF